MVIVCLKFLFIVHAHQFNEQGNWSNQSTVNSGYQTHLAIRRILFIRRMLPSWYTYVKLLGVSKLHMC